MGTTTRPRQIPTSANKAYGKPRTRGGTHSPTSTNETSREGEEGYELVDVHRRESPPPPPVGELEGMYEVPWPLFPPVIPYPKTLILLLEMRKTLCMRSFVDSTCTGL